MFSFLNSSQKIQHTILNEFYEKRISNSYITLEKKITDKKSIFKSYKYESKELSYITSFHKSNDGKIYTYFYGDLTNTKDICKRLGINSTENKSFLIYMLYIKYGKNFTSYIDGFFVLFIEDKTKDETIFINDHCGSKPLYFYQDSKIFFSSSDLSEIVLCKFVNKEINWERVKYYLTTVTGPSDSTFFKYINILPPGSMLIYKNNTKHVIKYFSFSHDQRKILNEGEAVDEFRELFCNSIKKLTKSDVIIGSALSGGMDSSSITSAGSKMGLQIEPITLVFNNLSEKEKFNSDEREFSNSVIKKYGLTANNIDIDDGNPFNYTEKMHDIFKEPIGGMNTYLHIEILEKLRKKNINFYMDGYDGDTIVSHGYEKLSSLGASLKIKRLFHEITMLHDTKGRVESINKKYYFKKYILKYYTPNKMLWLYDNFLHNKDSITNRARVINKNHLKPLKYNDYKNHYNGVFLKGKRSSTIQHLSDITNKSLATSLNTLNNLSNHYGIEIKFPFFDRDLMQFCINLPVDLKLKNGVSRYVFKRSMETILPKAIIERHTKSDIGIHTRKNIINTKNHELIQAAERLNFIDMDYFERQIIPNKKERLMTVWQIISLDNWIEHVVKKL